MVTSRSSPRAGCAHVPSPEGESSFRRSPLCNVLFMCQHPPDGLFSPGSARLVPAVDDVQTGWLLDETAADLALRATRYLRTRFRERVTIGDLSEHLAYSPSHLTRVFTAAVGTSPMDYLAAWRLHEAKHLLITHRLGVAETCHEVGYSSVGTFSRRFLRDVGTPPGALRRIADRVAERTQPPVSLLVPAVARIRIRPEVPEEMRRTLGPAPYQWVGTFPRPVPSGLPTSGTLRRHVDDDASPYFRRRLSAARGRGRQRREVHRSVHSQRFRHRILTPLTSAAESTSRRV